MKNHSDAEQLSWSEYPVIAGVEVIGLENLQKIQELNAAGKQVIFVPNHVRPNSTIRQQLALAEDYPKFQKVLKSLGLSTSVLFRGDGDMEIRKSRFPRLKKILYDVHRKIFSAIGRAYTGGIPLAINADEPAMAMMRNIPAMREINKTLKQKNLTIFPYGNWFPAREQSFEDLQSADFVPMQNFEQWRKSLKSGFVRIAKNSGVPIVPVYIDNTDGHWRMEFGEAMEVDKKDDNLEVGRNYLQKMQVMRNRNLLKA